MPAVSKPTLVLPPNNGPTMLHNAMMLLCWVGSRLLNSAKLMQLARALPVVRILAGTTPVTVQLLTLLSLVAVVWPDDRPVPVTPVGGWMEEFQAAMRTS